MLHSQQSINCESSNHESEGVWVGLIAGMSFDVIALHILQPKDTGFTKLMAAISKCAKQTMKDTLFHK